MTTTLDAIKQRHAKTGKVSARDLSALIALAEAFGSSHHALTCKGCRCVLEAAKPLLRVQPELKAMGKAGSGVP